MIVLLWVKRDETYPEPRSPTQYPREMKRKRDPAPRVPYLQISLNRRQQRGQDYPCEEIEKKDPRQKEQRRDMRTKGSHCCLSWPPR